MRLPTFVLGLSLCLGFTCTPSGAYAQYMFLDANGDGRPGSEERLPRLGPTGVDVWLNTERNRDGSASGLTSGAAKSGIAGYGILVQVNVARVEWGRFEPAQSTMRIVRGPITDAHRFFVEVECDRALKPGKHRLGRITLRPHWGEGSMDLLPCAVVGDTLGTFFRARSGGPNLRLGPTVSFSPDAIVVPGDWTDADGASFSYEPRPSVGPVSLRDGLLYLGWNKMDPPLELRIIDERTVVNGFAVPQTRRKQRKFEVTNEDKARHQAVLLASAVGRMFHELNMPDSLAARAILDACRMNASIDSVTLDEHGDWRLYERGVPPWRATHLRLHGHWDWSRSPDPERQLTDVLEELATTLNRGCLVQIYQLGHELIVPPQLAVSFDRAIQTLQTGNTLAEEDSVLLRSVLQGPDAARHPVRLERIHRPK